MLQAVMRSLITYKHYKNDDAFFNQDYAGACRGRWVGPGLLTG